MKAFSTLFACLLISVSLVAQKAEQFKIPLGAVNNAQTDPEDYFPLLQRLEAPEPGANSDKFKKEEIRRQLELTYPKKFHHKNANSTNVSVPQLARNWQANQTTQGVPNDNDIAIADNGKIASVVNSNIYTYDENGNALGNKSLVNFAIDLGVAGTKYDPRLLYDPRNDRFIITFLSGFSSTNTTIIVGFSKTNDPSGDWNLYALPGNPDGDSSWTDYPIISISRNELFITGNLLYDGLSWQEGFKSSLCWQINLADGYTGDSLNTILWQGFNFNGKPIRNLCPVKDGFYPISTGTYLLSNRNFTLGNDTIFLMQITDSIGGNPSLNIDYVLADNQYHMPPLVLQTNGTKLSTNDARVLDAFIENNTIQFVGNTLDTNNGFGAIYHGKISSPASSTSCMLKTISSDTLEFGYPSLAWMGTNFGTDESIIAVNFSSANHHPGYGAIWYDGTTDYSDLAVAKHGLAAINRLAGPDRWGDYSGTQRRYNQLGVCWIAATFGRNNNSPGTWLAEYYHPSLTVSLEEESKNDLRIAPMPVVDLMEVQLDLQDNKYLRFELYNTNGALIDVLLEDRIRPGKSLFTFSMQQFPAGIYYLKVLEPSGDVYKTEKLIVQ